MTNFDKEMQDALRADAEKLLAMGVDVADPVFLTDGDVDTILALKAERDALREACLDVGAHLVAAVSVIERAEESGNHPSCVYGSDKMYAIALGDFRKSIDRARSLLAEPTPTTEDEDGTPCRAISPARQRGASRA